MKAIKSSVLILLYPGKENSQPNFVVTLRPIYNGIHSGQISLPGGQFEFPDKTLMQTALRETHEEIGIDPADDDHHWSVDGIIHTSQQLSGSTICGIYQWLSGISSPTEGSEADHRNSR